VARDITGKGEDTIFAPIPPLEALRTIFSLVATKEFWQKTSWDAGDLSQKRLQLSFIDIPSAYFNARTTDENLVYLQLPLEDPDYGSVMCGRLSVRMYGTRQAADRWHCEYAEAMEDIGFKGWISSARVCWHPQRHFICSVHCDDFTTAGSKD